MGRLDKAQFAAVLALLLLSLGQVFGLQAAYAQGVTHQTIVVRKGTSLPVPVLNSFDRIAVSEPSIADAAPVSSQEYFVRGREIGTTNILVYNERGNLVQLVDVIVMPNLDAVRSDLLALFPKAKVDLHPVADRIHVSGTVADEETLGQIMAVVESHAPERSINALEVELPAQVLLEVRFVEASRDDIREIGFGTEIGRPGDFLFLTSSGLISGDPARAVGQVFGGSGATSIDFTLQALEEKGVVRTLAKPNLVSQSGQTASFLAGGEFPVPVAADEDTISIEFKEFGVSLEFTPTIAREDRIVLQVHPEVSNLDPRNSVRLSDVEIPALSVREIKTQVELGNGQSFAIAGLIQNDYQATELQTPLLGEIPILGNLFRSTRFKKNETELVVIITPHLVLPPEVGDELSDPIALSEEPTQVERYALSQIEGRPKAELGQSVEGNIISQSTAPQFGGR
ncbi:MAG: type II and III secretion system protein family protein [Pseudomonadota bacterium]